MSAFIKYVKRQMHCIVWFQNYFTCLFTITLKIKATLVTFIVRFKKIFTKLGISRINKYMKVIKKCNATWKTNSTLDALDTDLIGNRFPHSISENHDFFHKKIKPSTNHAWLWRMSFHSTQLFISVVFFSLKNRRRMNLLEASVYWLAWTF